MALTIPDQGEGTNDRQSILFQEDLDILVAGIAGIDCVLSGLAVTGGADMTPAVAKGAVLSNRTMFAVAAADVTIGAADGSNPRIDLIVVNSSGALAVRAGTAAATPKPPVRSANDVVIAFVDVPAADTEIATGQITDKRVTPSFPLCIFKDLTAKTVNNTVSATSIFNTAPVIPNGLFLTGRTLRVRAGGSILHNTTTAMTLTITISYGGTTVYADTSVSYGTTADADYGAWNIDVDLLAVSATLQRLFGMIFGSAIAPGPATTGIGDLAVDEIAFATPMTGANAGIAVDSNAANRTLDIQFTMSAASASHEWRMHGVIIELL